ncbi:MAG: DinB family protein [Acidobacteriia bacterium]|nr:DinB family protein [Terriglobia bacterium]
MKIIASMVAGVWAAAGLAQAASLTEVERQRLVAHFEMTASWLEDETSHLSRAQLEYHPAPGRWSILEVLEHLRLAEPTYWQELRDALKEPPSGKKPPATDADVLWYGIDRTVRQKTTPDKVPAHPPAGVQAPLEAFRKLHAEMLEYARTTQDDLRAHVLEKEGTDAYQWLLGISTHEQRHILQIREIKADRGFPKP